MDRSVRSVLAEHAILLFERYSDGSRLLRTVDDRLRSGDDAGWRAAWEAVRALDRRAAEQTYKDCQVVAQRVRDLSGGLCPMCLSLFGLHCAIELYKAVCSAVADDRAISEWCANLMLTQQDIRAKQGAQTAPEAR